MIERTLREFRRVLADLSTPKSALEVGALPDWRSILASPELANVPERIGVNLNEAGTHDGVDVVIADARKLPFEDARFELVVCNSTLEHIPQFWQAVSEMHRVLAPGGHLIVGTPGYTHHRIGDHVRGFARRRMPFAPDLLKRGTVTFYVHDTVDYYRFSEDSYREVILSGLKDVRVWTIMQPPRIIGLGRKP